MLTFWVRGKLRVMEIKEYTTLRRTQQLGPHNQKQFSVIPRISTPFMSWGGAYSSAYDRFHLYSTPSNRAEIHF